MQRGKGGGFLLEAVALALLAAGVTIAVAAWQPRYSPPPAPPSSAAVAAPGGVVGVPDLAGRRMPAPRPLPFSRPVHVDIPAIGVHARVIALGQNADGSVQVPALSTPLLSGWFDQGPAPGQRGPAVLLGHVDSAWTGPAVFYRLGDLRPGESVSVTRADHSVAVFRIYSVALYPKDAFPSRRVYGHTDHPELRLITCGGPFDESARSYLDNTVVFARLTSASQA
ncbi:MAG TPA: class F sortase [Streptosporangiaceae bacterium]|nr:class F sortase [Streptosporangiaceae bacterium]